MIPDSTVTGASSLPSTFPPGTPEQPGTPPEQSSAFLFRILQSAGKGSLISGALYYVMRLFKSKDSLSSVQSFLLFGAVNGGLEALAKETYAFGVHLLGDFQKNEEAIQAGQATVGNRLRQRCWKVIHSVDGFVNKIDAFVSKKLGIRTALELNVRITRELVPGPFGFNTEKVYVVHNYSRVRGQENLSILEVIRAVFWDSMTSVAFNMSMPYLSRRVVERVGYEAPRSMAEMNNIADIFIDKPSLYTSLALNFLFSLSTSFSGVYQAANQSE